MEFRFPLALLGSRRYFGMTFVDVDDPAARNTCAALELYPSAGKESFDLVVLGTPEVRNIVQGLGYSGARILVIDNQGRVRAEAEPSNCRQRVRTNIRLQHLWLILAPAPVVTSIDYW